MSLATSLSKNDQSVLLTILSGGEGPAINHSNSQPKRKVVVDLQLRPDRNINNIDELVKEEKIAIKLIENEKNYEKAETIFNSIIKSEPNYASVYNNLAQLKRIILEEKILSLTDNEIDSQLNAIIIHLSKSISLAEPSAESSTNNNIAVSKMQATILQSAYSQLGAIYIQKSELTQNSHNKWQFEEKASEALYCAGEYGSEMAKQLSSKINPYAKLCGNMVQEALARERSIY